MSDVFISYSRRDIDFVRHLFDQLMPEKKALGRFLTLLNTIRRLDLCHVRLNRMTSLSSAYAGHGIVNTLILDDFAAA